MSFKINKIYTDNPYVDEMVYYTKLLAVDTVLKMKDLADNAETAESLRNGDLYVSCVEGTAIIEIFDYISTSAFMSAGIINTALMDEYRKDPSKIPDRYRKKITETLIKEYINNYEETNSYYRMLHGLPPVGVAHYIEDWIPPDGIQFDLYDADGNPRPIHTFSAAEISILNQYGVIDEIMEKDPVKYEYMRHLGSKAIDYYLARRANRFDVLYIPEIESEAIYQMYRDKIDENKFYVLRTIYSEAFKYGSDYYDNIISIFIILITMLDIISRVQEFIVRKEIFDIRSVQYIFQSNGIPFFDEIPLKYQIAMVKNLHTLLKYKSTAKCMVDICSLFGFDNIQIFKYYLLKNRKTSNGEYVYSYNEDGSENLSEEYELKFLKIPIDQDIDSYIRDSGSYYDYDEITFQDPSWDGGRLHDEVIAAILKEEFNLTKTKYMSIDSIIDVAKTAIQQNYFFNILYDNVSLETMIQVQVPYISPGRYFNVADLFTLLTSLTYKYSGYEDTLVTTQSNVLYVNGFNFKADLATLAQNIAQSKAIQSAKDEALEVLNKYQQPTISIPSFNEMMNMYVNNLEVREELVAGMRNADNKEIYDIYKNLYDSLMIIEFTLDYYKNPDTGEYYKDSDGDITYSEFLKHKDLDLYNIVAEIDKFEDDTSREQYIAVVIDNIIYALEEFIDATEFQSLFSSIPAMSADAAKQYIQTVINFYKSYKVDFLGMNTIYTIDDKLDGLIKLIESADITRLFDKEELVGLNDYLGQLTTVIEKSERIAIIDRLYMDISTFVESLYEENIEISEMVAKIIISFLLKSKIDSVIDSFEFREICTHLYEKIQVTDHVSFTSNLLYGDSVGVYDRAWLYSYES